MTVLREVWKTIFHPRLSLLTSTVHDFPDVGSGQDVLAAQVVGQLAADGHNDGHHQVGQSRQYADLQPQTEIVSNQLQHNISDCSVSDLLHCATVSRNVRAMNTSFFVFVAGICTEVTKCNREH